jgi:signal transduction histidine kinase
VACLGATFPVPAPGGASVRSLRARLVLVTLLVAVSAVTSVAVLSRHAVRVEFTRMERTEREDRLPAVASALRIVEATPRGEIDARLAALAEPGHRLALLGPRGEVRGLSSPSLEGASFRREGDVLGIEMPAVDGRRRQMRLVGVPRVEIADTAGRPLGTLYALPPVREEKGGEPGFVATIDRWLLLSALAAVALALALSLPLARRILGPVEAITAAARRMEAGDLTQRVSATARDEIGDLARAFNAMADAVARSESLRRALVTDVAHELRTPLTTLRCQIEAVQDGLQPADAATLRSLHEETLLLARLVGDLEDLALAESGQLPLQRAPVAIAEAVDAALSAIRPLAAARGIALQADVPPSLTADADGARVAQVLRNLLANALTHTPEGGTVRVSARADGGQVRVEVADTGTGIAPEHLPHVFDRFYRADPSRARATGGAGLGLAIVKQLVEANGGRVSAASEPGAGARFTFTLPPATR